MHEYPSCYSKQQEWDKHVTRERVMHAFFVYEVTPENFREYFWDPFPQLKCWVYRRRQNQQSMLYIYGVERMGRMWALFRSSFSLTELVSSYAIYNTVSYSPIYSQMVNYSFSFILLSCWYIKTKSEYLLNFLLFQMQFSWLLCALLKPKHINSLPWFHFLTIFLLWVLLMSKLYI